MAQKLFIIESPNKIKSLQAFLNDYDIIASVGHIRNLVKASNSVLVNKDTKKLYINWENGKNFDPFEKKILSKKYDEVYLATDNDLEGERIANDIKISILDNLNYSPKIKRIRYNEISKNSIYAALEKAGEIDTNMVNAALGRTCIDYIFGFTISPVLWKTVAGAKSAGRVQSPSLSLIVDKYIDHINHVPKRYYTLKVEYRDNLFAMVNKKYSTKLSLLNDIKSLYANSQVLSISESLQTKYTIPAPIITSELQKYCNSVFGWSGKYAMSIAQKLYEGVPIKGKVVSLITYIRTDSVYINESFLQSMGKYLKGRSQINVREIKKQVNKGAHECIRPVYPEIYPDDIESELPSPVFNLYKYIYYTTARFTMVPPVIENLNVKIGNENVNISLISKRYREKNSDIWARAQVKDNKILYDLKKGLKLSIKSFNCTECWTKSPALLTESNLISMLEKLGIGKPSTYANITSVLLDRNYITTENKKSLVPTKLGISLNWFLKNNFTNYVSVQFTAQMEAILDKIKIGEGALWKEVYIFSKGLKDILKNSVLSKDFNKFFKESIKPDKYFVLWRKGDYTIQQKGLFIYVAYKDKVLKFSILGYYQPINPLYVLCLLVLKVRALKYNSKGLFVNSNRVVNYQTLKYAISH